MALTSLTQSWANPFKTIFGFTSEVLGSMVIQTPLKVSEPNIQLYLEKNAPANKNVSFVSTNPPSVSSLDEQDDQSVKPLEPIVNEFIVSRDQVGENTTSVEGDGIIIKVKSLDPNARFEFVSIQDNGKNNGGEGLGIISSAHKSPKAFTPKEEHAGFESYEISRIDGQTAEIFEFKLSDVTPNNTRGNQGVEIKGKSATGETQTIEKVFTADQVVNNEITIAVSPNDFDELDSLESIVVSSTLDGKNDITKPSSLVLVSAGSTILPPIPEPTPIIPPEILSDTSAYWGFDAILKGDNFITNITAKDPDVEIIDSVIKYITINGEKFTFKDGEDTLLAEIDGALIEVDKGGRYDVYFDDQENKDQLEFTITATLSARVKNKDGKIEAVEIEKDAHVSKLIYAENNRGGVTIEGSSLPQVFSVTADADIVYINGDSILGAQNFIFGDDTRADTPTSTAGDEIHGGNAKDTIFTTDGKDLINGNGGDDFLVGGRDDDTLNGGAGDDVLGYDSVIAKARFENKDVEVRSDNSDAPTLSFLGKIKEAFNTFAAKLFDRDPNSPDLPIAAAEKIGGHNDGNDTLNGGDGDDIAFGGRGNDLINGDNGDDKLDGGSGRDVINGGSGTNELLGGTDADLLISMGYGDLIDAGPGGARDADIIKFTKEASGEATIKNADNSDVIVINGVVTEIFANAGDVVVATASDLSLRFENQDLGTFDIQIRDDNDAHAPSSYRAYVDHFEF